MIKVLKGGNVYCPESIGIKDILVVNEKVVNIDNNIPIVKEYGDVEVIDCSGKIVVPGFIDQHVHIIGGGGEGGYATRTPEITLSSITKSGVTTVVGCLGTDGTTRHMASLLAKARGLEEEGISTYIYTGSYELPVRTLTNSVRDDIILIDKIIGCGEIAISDHRSSQPSKEDIKKLAAEARLGGILSGKAGVLHLHLGDGVEGLSMIFEIVNETQISIKQFTPTHINRNMRLLEDGIKFAKKGGIMDITTSIDSIKPSKAVKYALEQGVPIENITMSSDGNGSMPRFNEKGEFQRLITAKLDTIYEEFKDIVLEGLEISSALKLITENPAKS